MEKDVLNRLETEDLIRRVSEDLSNLQDMGNCDEDTNKDKDKVIPRIMINSKINTGEQIQDVDSESSNQGQEESDAYEGGPVASRTRHANSIDLEQE